jgi:hypothetical protein
VLRRCGFNIAQDVALRVCNDRSFLHERVQQ